MSKELLIVRHSEAAFGMGSRQDFLRELTEQGMVLANKRGRALYNLEIKPDLIYTSAATRAVETAKILADQIRYDSRQIKKEEGLYNISLGDLLNWLGKLDENINKVMLVGHNPVLSYLGEYLLDKTGFHLQPCDMVMIQIPVESWMLLDKNTGIQIPLAFG